MHHKKIKSKKPEACATRADPEIETVLRVGADSQQPRHPVHLFYRSGLITMWYIDQQGAVFFLYWANGLWSIDRDTTVL